MKYTFPRVDPRNPNHRPLDATLTNILELQAVRGRRGTNLSVVKQVVIRGFNMNDGVYKMFTIRVWIPTILFQLVMWAFAGIVMLGMG